MKRGRKPGYSHSPETIEKIRESRIGTKQNSDTRRKISQSLSGTAKTQAHRDSMSEAHLDIEQKCMQRFLELRSEYPEHESFFDENRSELLFAMRDIKSEKELRDLRRYIETTSLEDARGADLSYDYSSSSCYAQEDAMISLIDAASFLRRMVSGQILN